MSKLKVLLIGLLSVIVVTTGAIIYIQHRNKTQQEAQTTETTEEKKPEKTAEQVVITEDDRSYNEALSALEMAGHKASPSIEKEVKEAFKVVIKECRRAKDLEFDYTIENHLIMAKRDMIVSFAVALQQNEYDVNVDDIEVYESKSSGVVQFILKTTKKDAESIFWVGNYMTQEHQVSIERYYGGHVGKAFG
jgi:hypothetical protein